MIIIGRRVTVRYPDLSTRTAPRSEPDRHRVVVYEHDRLLVETVATFLKAALRAGGPAIAVATHDHLAAIERAIGTAAQNASFIGIDADDLLERISVDGRVDSAAFHDVVSQMFKTVAVDDRHPKVFGEMVAVLLERGDLAGVLDLEDLWNEVGDTHRFELLCGYPIKGMERADDTGLFRLIRTQHSSVHRAEGELRLSGRNGHKCYGPLPHPASELSSRRDTPHGQMQHALFSCARDQLREQIEKLELSGVALNGLLQVGGFVLGWLGTNTVASGAVGVHVECDERDVYLRFEVPCGAGITAPHGLEVLHALGDSGSLAMDFRDGTLLTVLQHPIAP